MFERRSALLGFAVAIAVIVLVIIQLASSASLPAALVFAALTGIVAVLVVGRVAR